ncbi:DNA glycosylase [Parathielavia hyrcaniae]|uniref:DNA-(apurinic or apyrimidinic site) lyase n=1 Tax=Parathielavia hyrcaniae TaxID=113614 RepID=A0AAN6T3V3_9PEZI|nr:DNA glycosylase [Parathielavia hyrcaniae]
MKLIAESFRWHKISDEWHCVLRGRLISLKQDASHLHYRVTWPKPPGSPMTPATSTPAAGDGEEDDTESLLRNYFALSYSLLTLYEQWAASDANFARRAPAFTGIRILNQDAWEALIAFICSSNNNISRISQMVQKLCVHYGPYIGTIEGQAFHDFPEPQALAGTHVEFHLRELGFGYRAAYIAQTAEIVAHLKRADWLLSLRNPESPAFGAPMTKAKQNEAQSSNSSSSSSSEIPVSYKTAHETLLTLPGVGPKVADCVCLMGLGWGEAVPVDTHVWQIAQRDYQFRTKIKTKTFTKALYHSVGDHFRSIWGSQAGWAQSVLFTANLKAFAGQASGAGTRSDVVEEGVVKAEKVIQKSKEVPLSAEDDGIHVVKAEEEEEEEVATTVGRSRKRRITKVTKASVNDGKRVGAVEVEVHVRRTSKRLKAAAS